MFQYLRTRAGEGCWSNSVPSTLWALGIRESPGPVWRFAATSKISVVRLWRGDSGKRLPGLNRCETDLAALDPRAILCWHRKEFRDHISHFNNLKTSAMRRFSARSRARRSSYRLLFVATTP